MEELGLDPLDLGNLDLLRPKLRSMLLDNNSILSESIVNNFNDK